MPIIAKSTGGGPKTLIPTGNHLARCYKMIYFGTVPNEYKGETKMTAKVNLGFEFPTETHVFDEAKGAQPLVISKTYTLSLGEKSNLRKDLQAWRGKIFTEEELAGFDITKVCGAPLMMQIGEKEKDNGDKSNIIQSLGSIPKGMTAPAQVNPEFLFNVEEFDQVKFDTLPEWIREEIQGSIEYKDMLDKQSGVSDVPPLREPENTGAEDLPFIITLLIASSILLQTLPF